MANEAPGSRFSESIHPNGDGERKAREDAAAATGYRFNPIPSAEFFEKDYRPEWVVKRLLVKNQPCVIGAPKKTLKTSIMIDLAISLASCTPFLSEFDVYRRQRVALISGESGEHAIQQTARRVCAARNIDPATLDILWAFDLPQLANLLHIEALCDGLKANQVDVLGVDPTYLCLLAGDSARGLDPANLYHMGPLFRAFSKCVLEVGTTPILLHHGTKHIAPGEPLELDHLAYAGIAEYARQWLLLNKREAYDAAKPGSHRLWLSVGGSEGQCGQWAVDVEEGKLGDDFSGRKWDVQVTPAGEAKQMESNNRETASEQAKASKVKQDGTAVLTYLDDHDVGRQGLTRNRIRDAFRWSGTRMDRALQPLLDDGFVVECEIRIATGTRDRSSKGIRRPPLKDDDLFDNPD